MFNVMKMRHFLAYLALTACLYICFIALPQPRQAAASTGVITGSVVNIRAGAGTQYDIAGSLYKDTTVTVLSQSGEWYKIQYGNTAGWVHQTLLSVTKTDVTLIVIQEPVNLRSGPGIAYDVIGQAHEGDILTCVDESGDWYKAKTTGGQVVYIRSDMVEIQGADTTTPTATATATTASASGTNRTPTVNLDGQQMQFEVPPVIDDGRTMVPLRAIFEAMGAQVQWNDTTKTVTAVRGSTTVILTIGSTAPTVNGQVWNLDVPAKIVNDRTLAPLRFVGEALGGTVDWDEASYTVTMQSPEDDAADVSAVTVGENAVNLRSGPATTYAVVGSAISGEKLVVVNQQNGWYQVSRGGTRVWVAGWVVSPVAENNDSSAATDSPAADDPEPAPDTSVIDDPDPVVDLEGLRLSAERTADGLRIMMDSDEKLDATVSKTSGKVSYLFTERQMEGNTNLREYLGTSVLTAVGSNQDEDVLVEITLPATVKYKTATENNRKREVLIIPNYIAGVSRTTFGSSGENINISTIAALSYKPTTTSTKLTVVMDNAAIGAASSSYKYDSTLIKSLGFKTKKVNGKTVTVMTLETKKAAKFSVGLNDDGTGLNIMFIDQSELQSRDPLVVLDAGHGGKDTGAIGCGLYEKDVNLAVVMEVGKILTKQGIRVAYTRTDDSTVALSDIPKIANMYNAAVFVSVHSNSNLSSTPSGTESYCYYPASDPELYLQKDERYNLALRLQRALVDKLGRIDRGVKQANFAVLRETTMPSALVEMAFISNPVEGALLGKDDFRELAAQAIAEAIAGYMESYY